MALGKVPQGATAQGPTGVRAEGAHLHCGLGEELLVGESPQEPERPEAARANGPEGEVPKGQVPDSRNESIRTLLYVSSIS